MQFFGLIGKALQFQLLCARRKKIKIQSIGIRTNGTRQEQLCNNNNNNKMVIHWFRFELAYRCGKDFTVVYPVIQVKHFQSNQMENEQY